MGTQGMVVILKDEEVFAKIVVGDNGMNVNKVADKIVRDEITNGTKLYEAAKTCRFGCPTCLVVSCNNSEGELIHIVDEDEFEPFEPGSLYATQFKNPLFNPRWEIGMLERFAVIAITTKDDGKLDFAIRLWGRD